MTELKVKYFPFILLGKYKSVMLYRRVEVSFTGSLRCFFNYLCTWKYIIDVVTWLNFEWCIIIWCGVNGYLHITWRFSVREWCYVLFSFRATVVKLFCNENGYFCGVLFVVLFVVSSNFVLFYFSDIVSCLV
jgi:hypothetical protein